MQFIVGTRIKIQSLIEFPGLLIYGMYQHRTYAENVGGPFYAEQGVFQQSSSQPASLVFFVNRQPTQKSDWNRVICKPTRRASGGMFFRDTAGGDRIIANDDIVTMNDIRSGAVIGLILKRVFPKPEIQ